MRVFKASLQIMKRHKAQMLIYFIMFTALFLVVALTMAEQMPSDFSAVRPNFTIISREEETPVIEGLRTYLNANGTEVVLEDQTKMLQDAMFYQETDYILIIPEGFSASLERGEMTALETAAVSGTAGSYYLDTLTNQYLRFVNVFRQVNPSLSDEALADAVLDALSAETEVELRQFSAGAPVHDVYSAFNRTQCYILLVLILFCVSSVTMAFRRPEIHMRNLCSPLTVRSKSFGQLLYCTVTSFSVWFLLSLTGLLLSASYLKGTDLRLISLLLLNSFLFSITALSIAMLASFFIKSFSVQNAFSNFLSLTLSFLGGVFVPLEYLSDGLITAARFTPVYWYSAASTDICSLTSFSKDSLQPIFSAFLTQLCFAAAILCVGLAVGHAKNRAEDSFGTTRTELQM